MILHLLHDIKFFPIAIRQFNKYFPNQNIYLLNETDYSAETLKPYSDVLVLTNFYDVIEQKKIVEQYSFSVDYIFVHSLDASKSKIASLFKMANPKVLIYWVLFGSDLYMPLHVRRGYKLFDYKPLVENDFFGKAKLRTCYYKIREVIGVDYFVKFLSICDYFCFWDKYDYELLNKYYHTRVKYKYFCYNSGTVKSHSDIYPKQKNLILVGNSASSFCNNLTVLRRLNEIDLKKELEVILPLSYGSPLIKKEIIDYLENNYKGRYTIIDDFLPYDQYVRVIGRAAIAIYGSRRQHAAGNIFAEILNGTKVYLRDDNNVSKVLKDMDCTFFSFEKDMANIDELLSPLPLESIINNSKNCKTISSDIFMNNLLTD